MVISADGLAQTPFVALCVFTQQSCHWSLMYSKSKHRGNGHGIICFNDITAFGKYCGLIIV